MAQGDDGSEQAVSWCNPIETRDGTLAADAKMVNCFIEGTPNGKAAVKRPGTVYTGAVTGLPQGLFGYNGTLYSINANTAFPFGSITGTAIPSPPAAGTPAVTLTSDNTVYPALVQFPNSLYTFNGTFTHVTDANYGPNVQPGIAFLDGVYYVMDFSGKVLGSAINDATTWPALDFVAADQTLGHGVSVARHLNYVVAYYAKGIQLYYDANSAPNGQGTALGFVSSGTFRTGCANAYTIVELSDSNFFVSNNATYGKSVQQIDGITLTQISTPFIEKILNSPAIQWEETQAFVWAFGVKMDGHSFYVLTLVDLNITLVYDMATQTWQLWSSVVSGVEQFFAARFYISNPANNGNGGPGDYMQDTVTGRVMKFSPTTYVDAVGNINVTCVSPNYDWGTLNWKRFGVMNQIADTVTTTVSVSFSDNDYQTFHAPRMIDLSTVRKQLRNCGSSRRRAWKLTHSDNTPLRLYDMKVSATGLPR
jgi:hypothetical protein